MRRSNCSRIQNEGVLRVCVVAKAPEEPVVRLDLPSVFMLCEEMDIELLVVVLVWLKLLLLIRLWIGKVFPVFVKHLEVLISSEPVIERESVRETVSYIVSPVFFIAFLHSVCFVKTK